MSGRFKDAMPLQVFIRRKQVLDLYRRLLRGSIRADAVIEGGNLGSHKQGDLYGRVRSEYRTYSNIVDSGTISILITEGMRHAEHIESMAPLATTKESAAPADADGSWLNSGDDDDKRGRVGDRWPWER